MTPKDKAIELCGKYHLLNLKQGIHLPAKECALIMTDEIIQWSLPEEGDPDTLRPTRIYWEEVKKEIKNL